MPRNKLHWLATIIILGMEFSFIFVVVYPQIVVLVQTASLEELLVSYIALQLFIPLVEDLTAFHQEQS